MGGRDRTRRVVVVGAGPVGVVCALALSRAGVAVTVFEQEPAPVQDQRAASLHPSTLDLLDRLGIVETILPNGLVSPVYRFHDRVTGDVVAEFDLRDLADELRFPFVLQYEQYKMTAAISAAYGNQPDFDVRFSHCVTGLAQDADGVTVDVEGPRGSRERVRAGYVIGCDGGRSTVRRLSAIDFEGFTYPEKFIKIATHFDFAGANANLVLRNYFSDPGEWCNLFKVRGETPAGLWRAIFPMRPDESDAEALRPSSVEARLQRFFPKAGSYAVEYVNVYDVHQRVAASFRAGRVLLAGDSAHANNPIGGMGMNGGIHDAVNLAAKLARVLRGEAESLLDLYSRQRRHAAVEYVQAQTIANKRLLEERDPAVRRHNLDGLRRLAEDKIRARSYMRRAALIESLDSADRVT
jgi:3-(3-hydroxy-phenyl)propionate hydroxylase